MLAEKRDIRTIPSVVSSSLSDFQPPTFDQQGFCALETTHIRLIHPNKLRWLTHRAGYSHEAHILTNSILLRQWIGCGHFSRPLFLTTADPPTSPTLGYASK